MRIRQHLTIVLLILTWTSLASPQQLPVTTAPGASAANADFLRAADEVMADMSKILSLPIREPLKRSVRSKDEIREYLVRNMHEDEDSAKRHADIRVLESLGLLPKGYPLEEKLIELLTNQIAGVYDPKAREFFIAASIDPAEQRVVMAHELTHALQDQTFHIQQWSKAAKNNDDASFARESVLEGSAMIAMVSYLLRDAAPNLQDFGSFDPKLLLGDVEGSEDMKDVPLVLRDQLLFPYLAGAGFSAKVLEASGGWPGLRAIFERPPASTQQIMHPDLYLRGIVPETVGLPELKGAVPRGWKKLDENIIGEFGFHQIFKQFLGNQRADQLAASWDGDRYAIYEKSPESPTFLVIRVRLAGEAETTRFFGAYSELLEKKYAERSSISRQGNFLAFQTPPSGGVAIRCEVRECLLVEGATPAQFEKMTQSMSWPAVRPAAAAPRGNVLNKPDKSPINAVIGAQSARPQNIGVN
jgi:hypothetical protein